MCDLEFSKDSLILLADYFHCLGIEGFVAKVIVTAAPAHAAASTYRDAKYVPLVSKILPTITGETIMPIAIGKEDIPRIIPKWFLPKYSPRIAWIMGVRPPNPKPHSTAKANAPQ